MRKKSLERAWRDHPQGSATRWLNLERRGSSLSNWTLGTSHHLLTTLVRSRQKREKQSTMSSHRSGSHRNSSVHNRSNDRQKPKRTVTPIATGGFGWIPHSLRSTTHCTPERTAIHPRGHSSNPPFEGFFRVQGVALKIGDIRRCIAVCEASK